MKSREPSEKAIQAAVIDHWRHFGMPGSLVAAIPNARAHGQSGLTKGLPDLLVIAPKLGACFIELKTERGRLSATQVDILILLEKAGIRAVATHGRDEPIAILEQWGVVRKAAA